MASPAAVFQGLSWDPWRDLAQMWSYQFMQNALLAGTAVAIMASVIGWFVVMRRQTFAGHTLAVIAFPGAAAAALAGLPLACGYFGFCGLGALILVFASAGRGSSAETAATGTLQAVVLGLGFLFVGLYHGLLGGLDSLLFGTFLGIDRNQVATLAVVAAIAVGLVALGARPLLYASLDPQAARAQGLRVGLLDAGFLLLLGLTVAAVSQITGALLVFSLLIVPAATARELTVRPGRGILLAISLALGATWLGLALAYFSSYPVGFYVSSLAFAGYALARSRRSLSGRRAVPALEQARC